MKRKEFKLLVENWRSNLVLVNEDADMMLDQQDVDPLQDDMGASDMLRSEEESAQVMLDDAIQNLVDVINQGMYQADDKQYALDQIEKLTQGADAFGLRRSGMPMSDHMGEDITENDQEMACEAEELIDLEIDKEIDEDDECGY